MIYVLAALAAFFYGGVCFLLGYMAPREHPNEMATLPLFKAVKHIDPPDYSREQTIWANIDNYGTQVPQKDVPRGDK